MSLSKHVLAALALLLGLALTASAREAGKHQPKQPDLPAAKAGLKTHDILLELGGKAVPSEVGDFMKALNEFKTGDKVDAIVLRKGKKETVKGVTLPEVPAPNNPLQFRFQVPGGAL